jgi:hypothetical protein
VNENLKETAQDLFDAIKRYAEITGAEAQPLADALLVCALSAYEQIHGEAATIKALRAAANKLACQAVKQNLH